MMLNTVTDEDSNKTQSFADEHNKDKQKIQH